MIVARALASLIPVLSAGCYAPLCSWGIPADRLPDTFRTPLRAHALQLNYAMLTAPGPLDYVLGPGDILEITIPELYELAETRPLRVQVLPNGELHLPMLEPLVVGGVPLSEAQRLIREAYADGVLNDPTVSIVLAQRATVTVVVLGHVRQPGVYQLPKYENDVAHALAIAGGLAETAGDIVEVHRRGGVPVCPGMVEPPAEAIETPPPAADPQLQDEAKKLRQIQGELGVDFPWESRAVQEIVQQPLETAGPALVPCPTELGAGVVRIPLRTLMPADVPQDDVVLNPGDVVVVPRKKDEVFFVVGRLSTTNFVRFSVTEEQRELGAGFLIPRDRDIDVVTAVTMAGYIDPISSPTTVTVHRTMPDGQPVLILVDLIKARYDRRENIYVQAGDIIYLNPDAAWYFRLIFNDVVGQLITIPYDAAVGPNRRN